MELVKPPHDGRFGISGAELVLLRKRDSKRLSSFRQIKRDIVKRIEQLLVTSGYLEGANFWWVTVHVRYGLKHDQVPEIEAIDEEFGNLPLVLEVDVRDILEMSDEAFAVFFEVALLRAVAHAGRQYARPIEGLERRIDELESASKQANSFGDK